jgi:hypothetical protein
MFAGAGADPAFNPWWPGEVHLVMGAAAILTNILCALAEYRLIRAQSDLMDEATAKVTQMGLLRHEPTPATQGGHP